MVEPSTDAEMSSASDEVVPTSVFPARVALRALTATSSRKLPRRYSPQERLLSGPMDLVT